MLTPPSQEKNNFYTKREENNYATRHISIRMRIRLGVVAGVLGRAMVAVRFIILNTNRLSVHYNGQFIYYEHALKKLKNYKIPKISKK